MVLSRYKNLAAHKRTHIKRPTFHVVRQEEDNTFAKCTFSGCSFKGGSPSSFLNHLTNHVRKGETVNCFCGKQFKVLSTLKSHFKRSHSIQQLNQTFTVRDAERGALINEANSVTDSHMEDVNASMDSSIPDFGTGFTNESTADAVSSDDFLKSFAMMLLRLQSKSFLSTTTLQFVTEAIRGISDHASDYQRKKFRLLADKYNIEAHVRNAIEEEIFQNSLHEIAVGDKGVFRTDHMRKKYYRENFDLLEPVEYTLNNGVEVHKYHYVPVNKSLENLLRDKSIQKLYNKKGESKLNVLKDFEDGTAFKENKFFVQFPNGIKIILYLDAFDPCDALKSARGKHKTLGVYMALGNLPSYCRSQRDPIQLIMLVKDTTLKSFNYQEVFAPLLQDLQTLHDVGIPVCFDDVPQMLRGCVVGISADNLEAHTLGGFNQSFSSVDYYCRFCYARRSQRIRGHVDLCNERTCSNYDADAHEAEENDKSVRGVWETSIFNSMPNFHVVNGLPSCIHHDVAEGFLPIDLFKALKILVEEKWFTWAYINAMVKIVNRGSPYVIREIKPKVKKIVGSASSNLHLLQIITLALVEKVKDATHSAWQMIVTLQEFMALVCAPEISIEQTFKIDELAEKYISLRRQVLPNIPCKCKHHYALHFGALTRKFGPLHRWSTIRFESKHQYFKSACKSTNNFVNLTFSLSARHQFLQAYLREGNMFATVVQADSVQPFKYELHSQELINALKAYGALSSAPFSASKAEYHGIKYAVGDLIMIKANDDRTISSILVDMVIVIANFTNLIFVGTEEIIKYHEYFGVYEVVESSNKGLMTCSADKIASPDPLVLKTVGEHSFTYLKHTIMVQF